MPIIPITSLDEYPELALFASLTEAQLRQQELSGQGVFIAESPKVIH